MITSYLMVPPTKFTQKVSFDAQGVWDAYFNSTALAENATSKVVVDENVTQLNNELVQLFWFN